MGAGFVFLPLTIPSVLSIPIAHFVRRLKPRMIVVTGFVIMTIPMMCLRWTQANTARHETFLVTLLFIIGVCLATVQAIIVGDVSNAVRRIERLYGISDEKSSGQGRGYALCNMAFAAGQAVGPIAGGYIKHALGWSVMTLFLGSLCLVAAGTSFFSISPEPPTEKSEDDMGCCEA
jgi:MFS family permease